MGAEDAGKGAVSGSGVAGGHSEDRPHGLSPLKRDRGPGDLGGSRGAAGEGGAGRMPGVPRNSGGERGWPSRAQANGLKQVPIPAAGP